MKIANVMRRIYRDHLYRNSIYLILNDVIAAGFGFLFWIICAKLFTTEQVGLATTIISAIGLVSLFSFLGLTKALIRYFPKTEEKGRLIGSCINLTALVSVTAAIVFLVLIPVLSPKLLFVIESKRLSMLFVLYTLFWVLFKNIESVFIATRRSEIVFYKSLIFSVCKVALPVLLVYFGTAGIIGAYYMSALAGFVFEIE